jgi:hypothetical protein
MIDSIADHLPAGVNVVNASGVPSVLSDDTSNVTAAAAMAARADAVVLVLGTDIGVACVRAHFWTSLGHRYALEDDIGNNPLASLPCV